MKYITTLQELRPAMIQYFDVDPHKICAKVIIGHSHDTIEQMEALRRHNAYLHGIEILTFDQLLKIGKQSLIVLQESLVAPEDEDPGDIPF